jgi:hypothetical protein
MLVLGIGNSEFGPLWASSKDGDRQLFVSGDIVCEGSMSTVKSNDDKGGSVRGMVDNTLPRWRTNACMHERMTVNNKYGITVLYLPKVDNFRVHSLQISLVGLLDKSLCTILSLAAIVGRQLRWIDVLQ